MNDAKLFVLSAPSGCGKGTLLKMLKEKYDFYLSISCTTREPREGEKDKVNYFFIDDAKFEELIKNDGFLEYAQFSDHSYGTPRAAVEENLAAGRDVILEIEPQGAFQVKEKRPDAVMLFILPPSVASIERRLRRRAQESGETEEMIQKRIKTVVPDIEKSYKYDYVMVNGDLDKAIADLTEIYEKAKNGGEGLEAFTAESMKNKIDEVLENA